VAVGKVLVTGADGFTGRYVVQELVAHGYRVVTLTRRAEQSSTPGVIANFVADLGNADQIKEIILSVQAEYIIHLAAISFVGHSDADVIYQTNLCGTRHLLEATLVQKEMPHAVLLASSANVYGNKTPGVIGEDAEYAPVNDYAVSKVAMEYLASLYSDRLPIIITRPFNYTGVGQSDTFLIPKIIAHVRERKAQIELGNLDVARDFSDVRMVAWCYRRLIETPAAASTVFNICSGNSWTLREVIRLACEISGHDLDITVNPAFVRANEVRVLKGDRSRLTATIGEIPDISLEDTLRWMIEA